MKKHKAPEQIALEVNQSQKALFSCQRRLTPFPLPSRPFLASVPCCRVVGVSTNSAAGQLKEVLCLLKDGCSNGVEDNLPVLLLPASHDRILRLQLPPEGICRQCQVQSPELLLRGCSNILLCY